MRLHRNIVRMTAMPSGRIDVLCVDEHLRYVHFTIPRRLSTLADAETIMHHVLDVRAQREEWHRNGSNV